jgi:hypothetical protein
MSETARRPPEDVARCIQDAVDDPGQLDLSAMLGEGDRKIGEVDRSKRGTV